VNKATTKMNKDVVSELGNTKVKCWCSRLVKTRDIIQFVCFILTGETMHLYGCSLNITTLDDTGHHTGFRINFV